MKQIESLVLTVRGHRVMLDADLASIYGVTTKELNGAVKRNIRRFPRDFAFRLRASDTKALTSQGRASDLQRSEVSKSSANRSQIVANSVKQRATQVQPWVFTDHGALMAANVLKSQEAIRVSVHVVRASVRLREMVKADNELIKLLDELERRISPDDEAINVIIKTIRELAIPSEPAPKRRIGFIPEP